MNPVCVYLVNHPLIGATTHAVAAVLAALICYAVVRRFIGSRVGAESELLSGAILARLGTLHALILALMFAQEMADYLEVSKVVAREASAINDVFNDIREYDRENPQTTAAIAEQIVN